ncbi:MAG: 50S ribosomal protein L19 [Chitinophagales bacterium]
MDILRTIEDELIDKSTIPEFSAGDNVTVYYRIREGEKVRVQPFRGNVIQIRGGKSNPKRTFTVRKISSGIGVERIFPIYSPNIEKIEVNKFGKVRRARLFYLRELTGKKARIQEKRYVKK